MYMKTKELTIEHKLNCLAIIYDWINNRQTMFICIALRKYLYEYFQLETITLTNKELEIYFPELMKKINIILYLRHIFKCRNQMTVWKIHSPKRLKYIKKVEKKLLKQYETINLNRRT